MASLTALLPDIAPTLGLTTAALYERQRALVRLKLLPTPKGRGPGSGAEATPETVALLLTAVLAASDLSDVDDRVRRLALAAFTEKKAERCRWTGAQTFVDAVSFLLSNDDPKKPIYTSIHVERSTNPAASISFVRGTRTGISDFGKRERHSRNQLIVTAELPDTAVEAIRDKLRAAQAAI
jgi:hypothetical protein